MVGVGGGGGVTEMGAGEKNMQHRGDSAVEIRFITADYI
jgi:hypothetical protein